jgi:hypothetical protein
VSKPTSIEIVRLAYQLWQEAGQPEGRDQEFYLQAERELQEAIGTSDAEPGEKPFGYLDKLT